VHNGRWPKLIEFARVKWEAAYADLRQSMREQALRRMQDALKEAIRSGLSLDDVQDAYRELIVQKVQES
jgi:hypothetical protein